MEIKNTFSLTITQLLTYAVMAFLLIAVAQYENVLQLLAGEHFTDLELSALMAEAFDQRVDTFLEILDANQLTAAIVLSFFWALLGVVVYLVTNNMQRFFSEITEDLIMESRYVHPRTYKHRYFWYLLIGRVALRVSALIGLLLYIFVLMQVLLPMFLQVIEGWLLRLSDVTFIGNAVLAFFGLILSFHVVVILLRLLLLRDRVFEEA